MIFQEKNLNGSFTLTNEHYFKITYYGYTQKERLKHFRKELKKNGYNKREQVIFK